MNGMIGNTISHYLILEKLGEGGMGVVYKGEDTKLKRTVALKFLTPQIVGSEEDKTRFVHEAQTSAALDHPNICTTYEIDEADGQPFIAMGYVEGRSLKQKIEAGPLKLDEALDIVIQAAEGLRAAHEKEIVHRDIKSANIMVTAKGHVKVMDFGLAKLPGRTKLTRVGGVMGTVAYMSPEQARGERVDHRTDIWSLGIVLYESVTGRPPFFSDYEQAMVYSILSEDPKPITGLVPGLPVELEQVVNKALAKSAADRYQHADEMLVDLRTLREEIVSGTAKTSRRLEYSWQKKGTLIKARRPIPRLPRKVAALLAVTVLLVLLLFLFPSTRENVAEWLGIVQVPEQKFLAVLPFINVGGDPGNQSYCDGIVETLNSKLTQLEQFHGSLWVVPTSDVRSREITSATEAQQSFGVNLVVTGSVQRMNGQFRLTMNLIDAKTLRQLSSSLIDYGLTNVSLLQDETVIRVASMLDVELNPQARRVLNAGLTTVPGAYEFYLQGLGYIQGYEKEENLNTAIGLFTRAIERDSLYALAYAGLGEAYWRRYEVSKVAHWVERAVKNCERAVELNDLLAPVNVTLGLIHTGTGRYDEAIEQFQRALALDPVSAAAYGGLARAYESMGRLKEAESTYKRAIELKPDYWAGYNELGVFYNRYGRYDEAVTQVRHVVDLTPQNVRGYTNLGGLYFYLNRWKDATEIFERSLEIEPNYIAYSNLATIYYYDRRYSDAARMYEKALGLNDHNYLVWGNLASAYYWTPDERPKAKEVYQRAISLAREQLNVNPNDTEVLSQVAGYYAMIGDRANVRSILQQLADLKPDDLQVVSSIGSTYEILGERELALQWIGKALEGGYSPAEIENEPGLKELRADTRFGLLLQRAGNKAQKGKE